jgi:hypothetical protein
MADQALTDELANPSGSFSSAAIRAEIGSRLGEGAQAALGPWLKAKGAQALRGAPPATRTSMTTRNPRLWANLVTAGVRRAMPDSGLADPTRTSRAAAGSAPATGAGRAWPENDAADGRPPAAQDAADSDTEPSDGGADSDQGDTDQQQLFRRGGFTNQHRRFQTGGSAPMEQTMTPTIPSRSPRLPGRRRFTPNAPDAQDAQDAAWERALRQPHVRAALADPGIQRALAANLDAQRAAGNLPPGGNPTPDQQPPLRFQAGGGVDLVARITQALSDPNTDENSKQVLRAVLARSTSLGGAGLGGGAFPGVSAGTMAGLGRLQGQGKPTPLNTAVPALLGGVLGAGSSPTHPLAAGLVGLGTAGLLNFLLRRHGAAKPGTDSSAAASQDSSGGGGGGGGGGTTPITSSAQTGAGASPQNQFTGTGSSSPGAGGNLDLGAPGPGGQLVMGVDHFGNNIHSIDGGRTWIDSGTRRPVDPGMLASGGTAFNPTVVGNVGGSAAPPAAAAAGAAASNLSTEVPPDNFFPMDLYARGGLAGDAPPRRKRQNAFAGDGGEEALPKRKGKGGIIRRRPAGMEEAEPEPVKARRYADEEEDDYWGR